VQQFGKCLVSKTSAQIMGVGVARLFAIKLGAKSGMGLYLARLFFTSNLEWLSSSFKCTTYSDRAIEIVSDLANI